MVRTLSVVLELPGRPSGIAEGLCNTPSELICGDMVGAGKGGEQAILGEELRCLQMKLTVPAQGIDDTLSRAREGRRIQNNEVVFLLASRRQGKHLEDIPPDDLHGDIVQSCVGLDAREVLLTRLHSRDLRGALLRTGNGKGSLVGEAIQHTSSLRP